MAKKHFNVDDAEDFDDGTTAVTYDEELRSSDESENENARLTTSRKQRIQQTNKKSKQREQASSLRVKNWQVGALESAEYAGKVVKRRDIASEIESADGDGNGDDDAGMESPDEGEMEAWSDAEPFGASDSEDGEQSQDDNGDAQDDESESESDDDDDDGESKDAEKLMRGFEKADSAKLMSAKDSAKVVEKALHVRHQKILWERFLEVQIYTKRLLSTTKSATTGDATDLDAPAKTQAIAQLYACIDAVSSVQDKLCNIPELTRPSPSSGDASSKKRKRTVDDVWTDVSASNAAALPQYNAILNTYTRKTSLARGSSAGSQAKKFKAVNQDILAQVESVLADVQRVKRKAHAPVDRTPGAPSGHTSAEDNDDDQHDDDDALDELMYDDSDFYQQLLKEFIESGGGGASADALHQRAHRKKKKLVNRKASKGRALRYTVHPKLENFMFPEPYPTPEMDADELFRSLFGHVSHDA